MCQARVASLPEMHQCTCRCFFLHHATSHAPVDQELLSVLVVCSWFACCVLIKGSVCRCSNYGGVERARMYREALSSRN
jgi:hypothetical protein